MATANEIYRDAAIRHQIAVRRFTAGEVRSVLKLIEDADAELLALLQARYAGAARSGSITTARFEALRRDIIAARSELMRALRGEVRSNLGRLVSSEIDFEQELITGSLPVKLELASVSLQQARAAIMTQPFSGGTNAARTLSQWFDTLERADKTKLLEAIQLGVVQGESIDTMVRRVAGTRARNFTDGALAITRRNAATVVRTGVNHVSNAAREAVWQENSDIIQGLRWTSTLDGRTSAICRARDGAVVVFGDNVRLPAGIRRLDPQSARPPAHPGCRSVMIAWFSIEGLVNMMGERPFVRDARTRRFRERDFRAEAKATAGDRWRDMTRQQRTAAVRRLRTSWANANVGRVPATVSYDEWLRGQPRAFQDEVLGKTKARAFRNGLHLDEYVDRRGNELTIKQLRARRPEFF